MRPKKQAEKMNSFCRDFLCKKIFMRYLSGWILNLGVVPLLRFSAFLFLPAFDFLRLLLFSVTRVLETMSLLLNQQALAGHFAFSKPMFLSLNLHSVKAILLCLVGFSSCIALAGEGQTSLTLGVGEHHELSLPKMTRFSVSSDDSISYKERPQHKSLLLKGEKPGQAQIMVWDTHGKTHTHNIFVIENPRQTKLQGLKEKLSLPGLRLHVDSHFIRLKGEVNQLEHYLYLKALIDKNQAFIKNQLSVSKELSDHIFARIYKRFFSEFIDDISCEVQNFDLVCQYGKNQNISASFVEKLKKSYGVHFRENTNKEKMQNYKVRLKLVQMEQMDGRQINLGLSQLNTRLGDLFKTGVRSVIENNELILKENNIQLSSLAEPEAIVQSGQEVSLDIGSDIPYTITSVQGTSQTQWKFAGLQIKIKLEKQGNALKVRYQTSFTRPSEGQTISGNRESSTIMVPLDIPHEVFQVSFQTLGQQQQNIPFLGDIPILGKIFTSTGSQSNYKNITGVIQIEKHRH